MDAFQYVPCRHNGLSSSLEGASDLLRNTIARIGSPVLSPDLRRAVASYEVLRSSDGCTGGEKDPVTAELAFESTIVEPRGLAHPTREEMGLEFPSGEAEDDCHPAGGGDAEAVPGVDHILEAPITGDGESLLMAEEALGTEVRSDSAPRRDPSGDLSLLGASSVPGISAAASAEVAAAADFKEGGRRYSVDDCGVSMIHRAQHHMPQVTPKKHVLACPPCGTMYLPGASVYLGPRVASVLRPSLCLPCLCARCFPADPDAGERREQDVRSGLEPDARAGEPPRSRRSVRVQGSTSMASVDQGTGEP